MRRLILALCCLLTFAAASASATEGLTADEIRKPEMMARIFNAAAMIGAVGHCQVVLNHPNPDLVDEVAYDRLMRMLKPLASNPDVEEVVTGVANLARYVMRSGELAQAVPKPEGPESFQVVERLTMNAGPVCQMVIDRLKAVMAPGGLLSPGRNL